MADARRTAITGAAGQLGRQLVRAFAATDDEVLAMTRPAWDITRAADLERLAAWRPDVVVNAAAWTDVDGCSRDPHRAMAINGDAAGAVAVVAAAVGALCVQISTNEVFDGTLNRSYREDDEPNPINPYGRSKLRGERLVAAAGGRHLIVRTAWLFGPGGTNFVTKILAAAERAAAAGEPLRVVDDEWGNPTWTPTLAEAIVAQAGHSARPRTVHLAGMPVATRYGWARVVASASRSPVTVVAISSSDFPRASVVPARAVLRPTVGAAALSWADETRQYVDILTPTGSVPHGVG